jgi:hypothetical protein
MALRLVGAGARRGHAGGTQLTGSMVVFLSAVPPARPAPVGGVGGGSAAPATAADWTITSVLTATCSGRTLLASPQRELQLNLFDTRGDLDLYAAQHLHHAGPATVRSVAVSVVCEWKGWHQRT